MSGFLRGSAGGVKRLRRQFHDIGNFLGRRPSNAGAKRPSWRTTHIGSPATVDESLGISTACPLLSSMGPPFQKKSQNFQKASCGLRMIRIHHGHRRGGHAPNRRRAISSVGRAPRLHRGCREFESLIAHHLASLTKLSHKINAFLTGTAHPSCPFPAWPAALPFQIACAYPQIVENCPAMRRLPVAITARVTN